MVVLQLDPTVAGQLENLDYPPGSHELVAGAVALARGRFSEAISLLDEGMRVKRLRNYFPERELFLASLELARAWVGKGDPGEAIEVLERASLRKERTFIEHESGALWLNARAQLAGLYRQVGREEEAQQVEDELRRYLAYADPDHPILLQLEGIDDVGSARASAN